MRGQAARSASLVAVLLEEAGREDQALVKEVPGRLLECRGLRISCLRCQEGGAQVRG